MINRNPHNPSPHGPARAHAAFHGVQDADTPLLSIDPATGLVEDSVLDSIVAQYQTMNPEPARPAPVAGPQPTPTDRELIALARDAHTVAEAAPARDQDTIEIQGGFSIKYQIFDARIRIKPGAAADPAVFDRIRQVVDDVRLPVADFDALRQALLAHPGQWIKLADLPEPLQEKINIFISPDELRAYMVAASTDQAGSLSILDVDRAAEKAGLRTQLNREAASRVVRNRLFGQLTPLSRGLMPRHGEHAEIIYHFETGGALSPAVLDTGNVDFKTLNRIPLVRAGDCLASRIPPTRGVNGISVFGRPVPAEPGRDMPLLPGPNTHATDDGLRLYADTDGQALVRNGHVHVQNIFLVDGDVDYGAGNIDFNGMVAVRGFVRHGFQVRADGDIIIHGGVEGAELESRGGDISILLGVQGAGRAEVRAAGHVRAKYISQASVHAGGDVAVQESIMHSSVTAGGSISATGPRGSLVGGALNAGHGVRARFIGSEAHAKTHITIERKHPETGEPVRLILARQKALVSNTLDKALATLRSLQTRLDPQNPDPDILRQLRENAAKTRALKDLLRGLNHELIRFQHACAPGASRNLLARQAAYPGVHINIEGAPFIIMTRYNTLSLGLDENGKISAGY